MLKEFKTFAMRGNVLVIAVGINSCLFGLYVG